MIRLRTRAVSGSIFHIMRMRGPRAREARTQGVDCDGGPQGWIKPVIFAQDEQRRLPPKIAAAVRPPTGRASLPKRVKPSDSARAEVLSAPRFCAKAI
jgi:hypothetical protein